MYKKNIKSIFTYVIIFALVFSFIPFGNFVANAEETNDGSIGEKKPIEIIEKRTATSKTFDNLDGTYSTEISQQPIHFKDNDGKWEEIDNTLIENENDKIQNTANEFTVEFDQTVSDDDSALSIIDNNIGIEMGLVETNDEDKSNTLQKSVNEVTGTVDDNSITYEQVADNVSVVYTVGADRVKEDIIYTEKPEKGFPEKFTYQVSLDGLEAQTIGQAIYLVDPETKEKKYLIEAPYMYDSFLPEGYIQNESIPSIPEEAKSYELKLETRIENGQLFIDLLPDAEWLNDENRQYPITIDPTIIRLQGEEKTFDTTIRSAFPTQTGGNDNDLGVGTANDGNIVRSLLKFDLSAIPAATTIVSADLNLWFTSTNSASPIDINLQKVTKAWEENEASWNKSNSSTGWAIPGGDYAGTKLSTISGITSPPTIDNALTNWQVPISVVQGWLTDSSSNHGFLLKSSNESTKIYKKFASSEQEVTDKYKPQLVITYKTTARLGLEDYWDYDSRPLTDGTNYVNITTLNNILQYTDLSILGYADFGLDFTRTYNSKDYEKSAFGYGWSFTGDEKIFINTGGDGSKLQYKDADGTIHVFSYDATYGVYGAPDGNYDKLVRKDASTYVQTDPYGYKTTFKVRESTNDTDVQVAYISNQEDRNGNNIYYTYDDFNRLINISTDLTKDVFGENLTIRYKDNQSKLIQSINYEDKSIIFNYKNDYLTEVFLNNPESTEPTLITSFTYNDGYLSSVTDGEGNIRKYAYINGDLESVSVPNKDVSSIPAATNYSLDRNTMTVTVTDADKHKTMYKLNNEFLIESVTNPNGTSYAYKYDGDFNVTELYETTVDGTSETFYKYDDFGNLLTVTSPEKKVESYMYTAFQNIDSYTDTNGKITKYQYDSKGNLTTLTQPTGENDLTVSSFKYNDLNGELISSTVCDGEGNNCTTNEYDINYVDKKKTTVYTDAHENKIITTEDLYGNINDFTDGKGNKSIFSYNLKNALENVQDAKGNTFHYQYDNNGNLVNIQNARGYSTNYTYTAANQIETEKNALGKITKYTYNDIGDLTSIHTANGEVINYEIDVATSTSKVKIGDDLIWAIKQNGNTTTVSNDLSKVKEYKFNNDGLMTTIDNFGVNGNIAYTYYGNEALESVSYPSPSATGYSEFVTTSYSTDDAYNTKEVKIGDKILSTFEYTSDNQLKNTQYALSGGSNSKTYDKGRLATETIKNNASNIFANYIYDFDLNNNIHSITNGASKVIYTYDELNQLESESLSTDKKIEYEYDDVGNRKKKTVSITGQTTYTTYDYNEANQLTSVNGQAYQYDNNGNLTNDGKYIYSWNVFNQLIKITTLSGSDIAEYGYDELGRRIYSNIKGTEIHYYYDGDSNRVLYEEDDRTYVVRSYLYDDNGNLLAMQYKGETYYYLTNYRGDVLALTDSEGNIVAEYSYDSWGNVLTQSGTMANVNPYRYAGYRYDENTKLYYLMARYYNPDNGVFISVDPVKGDITDPLTLNGYNYVSNNPVNFNDPIGTRKNPIETIIGDILYVQTFVTVTVKVGNQYVKKQVAKWIPKNNGNDYLKLDLQFFAKDLTKGINKKLLDGNRVKIEKFENGKFEKFKLEKDRAVNSGAGTHGGSYWKLKDTRTPGSYWTLDKNGNILRFRQ